jgi:hypothetical protein
MRERPEWHLSAPTCPLRFGLREKEVQMKYLNMARHWFWVAPLLLGIAFIAGGIYMVVEGREAKDEVRDAIVQENIVTTEDSAIPNVQVTNAETAKAQADVIEQHYLEATGGRTYSELDRDDPLRETAFQASSLRTSLNLAVMGFRISDLVIGMGFFIVAVGATFVIFLAPAVYWAGEVANQHSVQKADKANPGQKTEVAQSI